MCINMMKLMNEEKRMWWGEGTTAGRGDQFMDGQVVQIEKEWRGIIDGERGGGENKILY